MKKYLIGGITLALFTMIGNPCEGTVESVNADDTYTVGPSGCVK